MVDVIKYLDVIEKMTQFYSQVSQKPLFIVMRQYMEMVMDNATVHQVSSNRGLESLYPKHQNICQILLRS